MAGVTSTRSPSRWSRVWRPLALVLAMLSVIAVLVFLPWDTGLDEVATALSLTALVFVLLLRRQRAEKALDRSEANFRVLIERSPDAMLVHRDGRLLYVNPAAAKMLEYATPAELEGRSLRELMPPGAADDVLAFSEQHFVTRNGREISAEVSSLELELDDRRAVVSIVRDVTERKQMRARLVLADRMASVGTLAAGVAHEINNPLAYLMGNLAFAREQIAHVGASPSVAATADLPGRVSELAAALADAHEGAQRVQQIVKDLRTFSRVDEEGRGPVNVHQPLDSSIQMTRTALHGHARLIKEYGEVPLVEGNESRLGQVFVNLLINAAQAMPPGAADEQEIRVKTHTDDEGRVVVAISDTGPGIAPEVRERIFDPFFTTKPVGVGTGLGLSICHTIVTSMGGEISVESEPGEGATFTVKLPASRSVVRAAAPARTQPLAPRRARILVVDDEPMLGESVRRALAADHDVVSITSARDALDRLDRGESFDLVLCDVLMPQMDGMELYSEVRRRSPGLIRSIVFMSGGVFTPGADEFLAGVSNPVLEKPLDLDQLRGLIRSRI